MHIVGKNWNNVFPSNYKKITVEICNFKAGRLDEL